MGISMESVNWKVLWVSATVEEKKIGLELSRGKSQPVMQPLWNTLANLMGHSEDSVILRSVLS